MSPGTFSPSNPTKSLTPLSSAATSHREALNLNQPPLRPPASVFPPVWTALYGIMGYAAHRAVNLGTSPFNFPVSHPLPLLPCGLAPFLLS